MRNIITNNVYEIYIFNIYIYKKIYIKKKENYMYKYL